MSKASLTTICRQMVQKALKVEAVIIDGATAANELPSVLAAEERGWLKPGEADVAGSLRHGLFNLLSEHDVITEDDIWAAIRTAGAQKVVKRKDVKALLAETQAYRAELDSRRSPRGGMTFAYAVHQALQRREEGEGD